MIRIHPFRVRRRHSARRGVALLLVLIAMGTASTLTLGWLASQNNAVSLSLNVSRTLQARASASSGLGLAIAIMQTPTNWRTAHQDGFLLRDYGLSGGQVNVHLTDVATELPPGPGADTLRVRVTATVEDITQHIEAIASVSSVLAPDTEDVSGFPIWVASELRMQGQTSLERWTTAPMATLGRRLFIGTAADQTQSISFGRNVMVSDVTLISKDGPSARLMDNESEMFIPQKTAAEKFGPAPPPSSLPTITGSQSNAVAFHPRFSDWSSHPPSLTLDSGGSFTLPESASLSFDSLRLESGTTLVITGNAQLSVHGDLDITGGNIVLAEDASLNLMVGGGLKLDDAYVGDEQGAGRDDRGMPTWFDTSRLTIAATNTPSLESPWRVSGNSLIKAQVEAPARRVVLRDQSLLAGRIAVDSLKMRHTASVVYDHGIDSGRGFNRSASLLPADRRSQIQRRLARHIQGFFKSVEKDLDPGWTHRSATSENEVEVPASLAPFGLTPDQAWYDTPSSREIPVEVQLIQRGGDTRNWESTATTLRRRNL